MKKKLFTVGLILMLALAFTSCKSSFVGVTEDNVSTFTMEASSSGGSSGSVTVESGQCITISSDLSDGTVDVFILKDGTADKFVEQLEDTDSDDWDDMDMDDWNKKLDSDAILCEGEVSGDGTYYVNVEPGDYELYVGVTDEATGEVKITAKSKAKAAKATELGK